MAAHIAGYWMKKHFQLPWVAEIHDPLVYDGWDKSGAQLRLSRWLERKICTSADAAVWFTLKARDRALSRHPQLMNRGHCIYAGVDRPKLVQSESRAQNFSEKFVFAHFGSLSRTRSLLCFLQGLEVHLLSHPSHRHLIRVEIYGGGLDPQSLAFVHGQGLGDVVCQIGRLERDQHSGRSGRDRVLQRMGEVDCLLLLHGEQPVCEEYIPSKLYEYLWMGPVILGAVWRNPELESILLSQGHLAVPSNDVRGYSLCIASLLQDWSYARIPKPSRTSPYTAQRSSESLVNLIAQLKALNAQ